MNGSVDVIVATLDRLFLAAVFDRSRTVIQAVIQLSGSNLLKGDGS